MKTLRIILILFLLVGLSKLNKSLAQNKSIDIPEMNIYTLEDKSVSTSVIYNNGKPFIVVFWAVWNKTCLLELNTIHEKILEWEKKYSVKLFAISIDEPERMQRAREYAEVKKWHYSVYFDHHGDLEHKMNILGVPHMILFNGEGKRVWEEHDYHSGDELELEKQLSILLGK